MLQTFVDGRRTDDVKLTIAEVTLLQGDCATLGDQMAVAVQAEHCAQPCECRDSESFLGVDGPRRRTVIDPLINVVTIALCAVVCGADNFVAIAAWGRTKKECLAKFLDLRAGIPSHDRFNAIFAAIKPVEFEKCLLGWITALHEISDGQIVADALSRNVQFLIWYSD